MNRSHSRRFYSFRFCIVYLVNFIFVVSVIVKTQGPSKCDSADYTNCREGSQNVDVPASSRGLSYNEMGTPSGPSWDISEEYSSINDSRIQDDMTFIDSNIRAIEKLSKENIINHAESNKLIQSLVQIHDLNINSIIILKNLNTFALCISSTDNSNMEHNLLWAKLGMLAKRISIAYEPASHFLEHCSDETLSLFFSRSKSTAASEFNLLRSRKMNEHSFSRAEEDIINSYSAPGIISWGNLYKDISRSIKVVYKGNLSEDKTISMGLSSAESMLDHPNAEVRKSVWIGINNAWKVHYEACAAALNAITSWRLENARRMRYSDFLFPSLFANRMTRKSLDAMMLAIENRGSNLGQKALQLQAIVLGKPGLEPWDLSAPLPSSNRGAFSTEYTFNESIELIADAADRFDPSIARFVRMMRDKRYIEATSSNSKRSGSYCTYFFKTKTPRVYLSDFNGRSDSISTLAHELGHAWHWWAMRDEPVQSTFSPMNMAETASTFLETATKIELSKRSSGMESFVIQWTLLQNAITFLCNIPARYEFEKQLNERRPRGRLSPAQLDEIMVQSWGKYYGSALESIQYTGSFFASKRHFYMTTLPFCNYSYTFGYLFSLSIFSYRGREDGKPFSEMYRDLLRDTGKMTAEELVHVHLGRDIETEAFWLDAISLVEKLVVDFETTGIELGYF